MAMEGEKGRSRVAANNGSDDYGGQWHGRTVTAKVIGVVREMETLGTTRWGAQSHGRPRWSPGGGRDTIFFAPPPPTCTQGTIGNMDIIILVPPPFPLHGALWGTTSSLQVQNENLLKAHENILTMSEIKYVFFPTTEKASY
ncbi:hypothetical protein SESBI_07111 [Sesbania bispinosa]|nr:hypothetical protein SESBI_07111 [Sesbania bispinosa]